jgi:hypothetical protein
VTFGGAFVSDIDPDGVSGTLLDTMDRTTADYQLGSTTPGGLPWTVQTVGSTFYGVFQYSGGPPAGVPADVVGDMFFQREGGNPTVIAALQSAGQIWESPNGFVLTGIFSVSDASGIDGRIQIRLDDADGTAFGELVMHANNGGVLGTVRVDGTSVHKDDWVGFPAAYWFKWERIPGVISRAKVWIVGDPEPDWYATHTPVITIPLGGFLQLRVDPAKVIDYDDAIDIYRLDFSGSPNADEFESIATGFGG